MLSGHLIYPTTLFNNIFVVEFVVFKKGRVKVFGLHTSASQPSRCEGYLREPLLLMEHKGSKTI